MNLNELVSAMASYRDSFNQITQKDGDLGDGLNRVGVYYSCLAALDAEDDTNLCSAHGLLSDLVTKSLGLPLGRFCRGYSTSERWFNNPNNVTRDQMVTVEAALALNGLDVVARPHFWRRALRLFTHFSTQNDGADAGPLKFKLPDLCSPDEFGTLIRATRYKFLYFLLPLTDLWLLGMVKWGRKLSERSLYDADNQLLPCVLAAIDQPSFVTEYVRRAYATTDAAERLKAYYSEQNNRNGIEPLGTIAALAFERCVGGLKN